MPLLLKENIPTGIRTRGSSVTEVAEQGSYSDLATLGIYAVLGGAMAEGYVLKFKDIKKKLGKTSKVKFIDSFEQLYKHEF